MITGGGGYVGCVLTKKLLNRGYYVRVLDRLIFGKEPLSQFMSSPYFDLQVGLIEDKYIVEKCLKGIDYVIHLAGISDDPSCEIDADYTRKINIDATKTLVSLAKANGVKRFVYASSCSIYGFVGDLTVDENSPPNPLTTYAQSKVDCEKIILPESTRDFATVCLRKSTIYGPSPRMRFDLVINTMTGMAISEEKIVINGGEQWRPFLHVEDAANAYIFMLNVDKDKINGQVFNVGSNGQNIKIIDLANKLAEILSKYNGNIKVQLSPSPDKRSYRVNFDKITSLGWQTTRSVEEGCLGVKKLFDDGVIKEFRDINYFNIKRLITYLNV